MGLLLGHTGGRSFIFQSKICNIVRELNPKLVENIELYVAKRGSDCYRSVLETINNYRTQGDLIDSADELRAAVVDFLEYTSVQSEQIERRLSP